MDYQVFEAGDVVLQSGATIRNCKLAYKTFGQLNARKAGRSKFWIAVSGVDAMLRGGSLERRKRFSGCVSACKKDPLGGVIGVQKGPL
jgi:hypothetical protein